MIIFGILVHPFSIPAITNCCQLGALKQHTFIIALLCGPECLHRPYRVLGFGFEMALIGFYVRTLGSRAVRAILGRSFERWSLPGVTRGIRPLEVTDLPCFLS